MTNSPAVYIQAYSAACALGADVEAVAAQLFSTAPPAISDSAILADGRRIPVGRLSFDLGEPNQTVLGHSRTNRLLARTYAAIAQCVAEGVEQFGASRVGVVIGTSTSGIAEGEVSVRERLTGAPWSSNQLFRIQELSDPARALVALSQATGPAYVVSTACTSGAKALAAGARMIVAGLCDMVVCGGADTLCDLTLNGFGSLDAVSEKVSNPFSVNRDGINIGEGGALFVLSSKPSAWRLAGWGESSDAYHISAPDPSGRGAELAALKALKAARILPGDIGYVHLHGTGTRLNDQMEAGVVSRLFGDNIPVSSTKPMTGHTLAAAGACQAAFCLMAMEHGSLPPHLWDGEADPELPMLRLATVGEAAPDLRYCYSASYAFGGNNAALILARE